MSRDAVDVDLKERGFKLAERLGVPRKVVKDGPVDLWTVPLLEKIVDALEKLEENYGKK